MASEVLSDVFIDLVGASICCPDLRNLETSEVSIFFGEVLSEVEYALLTSRELVAKLYLSERSPNCKFLSNKLVLGFAELPLQELRRFFLGSWHGVFAD